MQLEPQVVAQLKMRQDVIGQLQYLARLVETERNAIINQATGVDVAKGKWNLDLDNGVLTDVTEPVV